VSVCLCACVSVCLCVNVSVCLCACVSNCLWSCSPTLHAMATQYQRTTGTYVPMSLELRVCVSVCRSFVAHVACYGCTLPACYVTDASITLELRVCVCGCMFLVAHIGCYRMLKTHRIPYLHRSFSAKVTYIQWLFCGKRSAT